MKNVLLWVRCEFCYNNQQETESHNQKNQKS